MFFEQKLDFIFYFGHGFLFIAVEILNIFYKA